MPCPVEKRVSEHSRSSCSQKQVRFLILFNNPSGPSTLAEFLCLVAYFFFSRRTMTCYPMHFEIESSSILQCIGGAKLYHFMEVRLSVISGRSHSLSKSLARHNRHQGHPEQPEQDKGSCVNLKAFVDTYSLTCANLCSRDFDQNRNPDLHSLQKHT